MKIKVKTDISLPGLENGEYEIFDIRKNIWGTGNMGIQIWIDKNKVQDYVLQESDFNFLEKEGYIALIS